MVNWSEMKRTIGALIVLGLIGGAIWIGLLSGTTRLSEASYLVGGVLYEPADEATRAKIFTLRALAATELMEPLSSRTYLMKDREAPAVQEGNDWALFFGPNDCAPRGNLYTCRPVSGDRPTEVSVRVSLIGSRWEVVEIEGDMPEVDRDAVIRFSLQDEPEPSRWDMTAAAVGGEPDNRFIEVWPIWVGPYPTKAPGSVCKGTPLDADGEPVGRVTTFYQERPTRPFEVHGWSRGGGINLPAEAVEAEVECRQRSRQGWVLISEPELIESPGGPVGAEATMRWEGEQGFTAPLRCHITLLDPQGEVVWEGDEFPPPVWPPDKVDSHPYETVVRVSFPSAPSATEVGEFDCESL